MIKCNNNGRNNSNDMHNQGMRKGSSRWLYDYCVLVSATVCFLFFVYFFFCGEAVINLLTALDSCGNVHLLKFTYTCVSCNVG